LFCFLGLATAISSTGIGAAAEWQIEMVDQSGSAEFTSLRVDPVGNVHVAYVPDTPGHPLKYAFWDHATRRWFTMTVTSVASFSTLTLDSTYRPHISYADHGTGLGARLRHAQWDGISWKITPIDVQPGTVVAYYTGIALDNKNNPFFSYYDYADRGNNFRLRLRSVFWIKDHWEARTVDPEGGSGKFNAIAVDSGGRPQIAYANVKYETSGLRYATWVDNAWKSEIIEGGKTPSPVFSVAMILDKSDNPHIAYSLTESGTVKYATKVGGKWVTQAVDSVRQVAYPDRNGIVLDSRGNPYISYYDGRLGTLKVAYRQNGKWMAEVLDADFSGFTSSLAIHDDTLWVAYADTLGRGLKVARRPLHDASPEATFDTSYNKGK
jgi:hypothetical protein